MRTETGKSGIDAEEEAELKLWASAMAAGVPDELYWRCTKAELEALMRAISERERTLQRAANLRAGLIAAVIRNLLRKKGSPAVKPGDFFHEHEKMTVEQAKEFMLMLARRN